MKKRRILIAAISGMLAVMPITAYAAELGWVQDERGWKYKELDGNWATNCWMAGEDNTRYYLDADGYMLTNCYSPDGHWIDKNGVSILEDYGEKVFTTAESYRGELFYPEESDYPLKGTLAYSIGFNGKPELFQNNPEYVQINSFSYRGDPRLHDNIVLLYMAGLWDQGLTQYEEKIVNTMKEFLISFDWKNATDYEKAERAVRFIAEHSVYDKREGDGLDTNSSYSCLVKGFSSCDGMARTFHLLTRAVGMKSTYVSNLIHAWNFIKVGDTYYEIDPSILTDIYHNQNTNFEYLLNNALTIPADNANEYIWTLNGTSLQFDSAVPTEPVY
ncbi:MAG: hypothetical protein KH366_24125 [Clostridiaceae bacterium]|nr:hypothetical protein [Clostridiaceae bacterium]